MIDHLIVRFRLFKGGGGRHDYFLPVSKDDAGDETREEDDPHQPVQDPHPRDGREKNRREKNDHSIPAQCRRTHFDRGDQRRKAENDQDVGDV